MMVLLACLRNVLAASDALEQVGVAVGSSAAVAELPDARPELHGTAVAHPALRHRGHATDGHCLAQRGLSGAQGLELDGVQLVSDIKQVCRCRLPLHQLLPGFSGVQFH